MDGGVVAWCKQETTIIDACLPLVHCVVVGGGQRWLAGSLQNPEVLSFCVHITKDPLTCFIVYTFNLILDLCNKFLVDPTLL
jgi:hypothetical protein